MGSSFLEVLIMCTVSSRANKKRRPGLAAQGVVTHGIFSAFGVQVERP